MRNLAFCSRLSAIGPTLMGGYNKRISGYGASHLRPKFAFGKLQIHANRYTQSRALRLKNMHPLRQEADYPMEK